MHAHHLSTGNPADRTHTCTDTSIVTAITSFLSTNTEHWANIPWACLYCGQVNHGLDSQCSDPHCQGETGASRDYVLTNILRKIGQEILLMDEVDIDVREIWPVQRILQVILSPHNRDYCGLLTGVFKTPNLNEDICACCTSTSNQAQSLSTTAAPPALPSLYCSTTPAPGTSTTTIPPPSHTTSPPTGTSTTTISPPPSSISSTIGTNTSTISPSLPFPPPPAPAQLHGPLQALSVDDTVKEVTGMDITDTEQPHHTHTYTPGIAMHDRLLEEEGHTSVEGRMLRLSLDQSGTNGLITFPTHNPSLDHLPIAVVTPTPHVEEAMEDSSDSSADEYTRLVDLMEQEALEQELAELELLYTTESDTMETAAPTITTPTVTTSANPIIPTIDASSAIFSVTDVRLRQTSSPRTNTTTSVSTTPITTTGTSNPQAHPRHTSSPSPHIPSQAATPPYLGARPRTRTPLPLSTSTASRRTRPALLPTPTPSMCPSAAHLFWWCETNNCGRAHPTHYTVCTYCGMPRVARRKRQRGE